MNTAILENASLKTILEQRTAQDLFYLQTLYCDLHQHPELSLQEEKTSARMAGELRRAGYEVSEKIGGNGVVGVLKNGRGPTILVRTDMDALPVTEETGKPYASQVTAELGAGQKVGVMHACGHDMHMTVWVGTARLLASNRDQWRGTLVFVGQPAEELGIGARTMIEAGLFRDFPRPDSALALHVHSSLPAGTVAYTPEFTFANVELMEITVHGKGGHGAYPQTTQDPVLLASRIVVALQSITTTELSPLEPAVISVGYIQGGTKANVVPDEVKLGLTVRSYSDETHRTILRKIKDVCEGLARVSGLAPDQYPTIASTNAVPSTYNDPELTARIAEAFESTLGTRRVRRIKPAMTGEDFAYYGRSKEKIPIFLFWLGAVDPAVYAEAVKNGRQLPSLHNCKFAPKPKPTIKTGVTAMTTAVMELLNGPER